MITTTLPAPEIRVSDERTRPFYWIDNTINLTYAPLIKVAGLAVYTVLALHAWRTGSCVLSLDTIARESGLATRETVMTALERLEEHRLVRVERSPGRRAHEYTLLDVYAPLQSRPVKPSTTAAQAPTVGKSDSSGLQLSENPTVGRTSTVGKSDSSQASTVGKSDSSGLQLSENPTLTRDKEEVEDDSVVSKRNGSSSSSPASSAVSWESLQARYGEFEVRRAVEAAPEDKQRSVRYVAGILRNWEKEETARPKGRRERRDTWAEREQATPAADDDDADAADETLPPPPPVRKAEVEDTRTPWERVLEHMRKFSPWYGFSTLEFVSQEGREVVVRMADHPADSNNYRGGHEKVGAVIRDAWLKVNGEIVKVRVLPGEGPLVETGDDERKD